MVIPMSEYAERLPGEVPSKVCRKQSHEETKVKVPEKHAQIFNLLEKAKKPLTAYEVSLELNKLNPDTEVHRQTVAPRLTEMVDIGLAEEFCYKIKCQKTGKMVTAYTRLDFQPEQGVLL